MHWTVQECNELIKRANEIYMSIRRVKMLGDNSSEKIQKLYEETEKGADAVNISDEDSESDHWSFLCPTFWLVCYVNGHYILAKKNVESLFGRHQLCCFIMITVQIILLLKTAHCIRRLCKM